jgi:hypothetical protein
MTRVMGRFQRYCFSIYIIWMEREGEERCKERWRGPGGRERDGGIRIQSCMQTHLSPPVRTHNKVHLCPIIEHACIKHNHEFKL